MILARFPRKFAGAYGLKRFYSVKRSENVVAQKHDRPRLREKEKESRYGKGEREEDKRGRPTGAADGGNVGEPTDTGRKTMGWGKGRM